MAQLQTWVWPDHTLVINDYTDAKGTPEYNMRPSQQRAKSIFDCFANKGAAESKMNEEVNRQSGSNGS